MPRSVAAGRAGFPSIPPLLFLLLVLLVPGAAIPDRGTALAMHPSCSGTDPYSGDLRSGPACCPGGFLEAGRHAGHDEPDTTETAEADTAKSPESKDWFVNEPHGPADTLRFETDEATWMSVDVSPDGRTLVFDILGDLYTLPVSGGAATRITDGPAWDFGPSWSPDGQRILFTSDRGGTDNVWTMKADGTDLYPLTTEKDNLMNLGAYSPDGEYIVARKRLTDRSSIGTTELWLVNVHGGSGVQLTKKDDIAEVSEPVFSPDGRYIYFSARPSRYSYNRNVYAGIYQIRRYDRETGDFLTITDGYGGSGRPQLSPDGRTMAFIRRDRLKTVLYLFDIERRTERPLWDGLDQDMQENFAWTGIYPNYSFTPDGKSIVITAGGKFWSVDVATGTPKAIPFTAQVEQVITKALRFPRDIASDTFPVRMIAWPVQAPDGKSLLFSAIGSLWSMPLPNGTPRKLASEGGLAYSPSFSRDGRTIAYVSWSDTEGGHVWTMPAAGGRSKRLTTLPAQYANPAFSPDGTKIAVIRGNNAAFRGHNMSSDSWLELLWLPAAGGDVRRVVDVPSRGAASRMPRPVWNSRSDRILYFADGSDEKLILHSIRPDGTDRKELARIKFADDMLPSPDGKWLAYNHLHNAYIMALPDFGTAALDVSGGASDQVPSKQFTKDGGEWLNWADGGKTVTWSHGATVYRASVDSLLAEWDRAERDSAPKKMDDTKKEDAKSDDPKKEGVKADDAKNDDAQKADSDADKGWHPDTLRVNLVVPRAKPSGTVALTGGRLITMNGNEIVEDGTIVVENNRITMVGPTAAMTLPAGTRTIDITGKTVMPGMFDTHAHLHYNAMDILPEQQWAYWCNLAFGVTTTHDPSASSYAAFTQSEMVEAGVMTGPRTWSTGMILYGADGGFKAVVKSREDAADHIRRMKAFGAFSVKSYMQPRREQRQWIIEAARAESILVMPEGGGNLEMNLSMVVDGHTSIEHNLPVAPIYSDVARLFAGSGTVETPTLLVSYGGLSGEHYFYQRENVWENEKLLRFHPRGPIDARSIRREVMTMDGDWHHKTVAAGLKKIVEAGGKVTLGAHGQLQGLGPHWELEALTHGGMTNHDALRCATYSGAWELGMDRDLGSLEPGKLADFIVLDKNPLEEIRNARAIRYVVKNGVIYEGETMNEVWPEAKPCPKFTFQALGGERIGKP